MARAPQREIANQIGIAIQRALPGTITVWDIADIFMSNPSNSFAISDAPHPINMEMKRTRAEYKIQDLFVPPSLRMSGDKFRSVSLVSIGVSLSQKKRTPCAVSRRIELINRTFIPWSFQISSQCIEFIGIDALPPAKVYPYNSIWVLIKKTPIIPPE